MINKKDREFIYSKIKRYRQFFDENWASYQATDNSNFREQAIICQAKADCLENLLISLDMAKFEMGGRPA